MSYACCNSTYRLRYWNGIEIIKDQATESCNSTYRLRYWNICSSMNIPTTDMRVATVLTACGIETFILRIMQIAIIIVSCNSTYRLRYWNTRAFSLIDTVTALQQYLPLAVLKLALVSTSIQTLLLPLQQYLPLAVLKRKIYFYQSYTLWHVATVLTACGIETLLKLGCKTWKLLLVATVLTACGIETWKGK